jgi:hypothetical protein
MVGITICIVIRLQESVVACVLQPWSGGKDPDRYKQSGFCEGQVKESEALLGQISQKINCVKNQRVDLSPEMFQQVQQLAGRDFTKFVSSKGVLHSSYFHSLD